MTHLSVGLLELIGDLEYLYGQELLGSLHLATLLKQPSKQNRENRYSLILLDKS